MSPKVKVFCIMLVAILISSAGEALAAKGLKSLDTDQALVAQIKTAFSDWHVPVGLLLLALYILLYVYTLSLAELSVVVPLSALSYLIGALASKYYLHEDVKPARWVGTIVIIVGVLIVAWSGFSDKSQE